MGWGGVEVDKVETGAFNFLVIVYIYIVDGEVRIPFSSLTLPHFCACPKLAQISNCIYHVFFLFSILRWEVVVRFVDIDGIFPDCWDYMYSETCLNRTLNKPKSCLNHGWWFSPGTAASSTTKTGRHYIAEMLLKVALKHHKSKSNQSSTDINRTLNKPKSCINRTLNKPKSCINRTLNKPKSYINWTLNKPKSCLNQTLNKPKSCLNRTLNKPKSCINRTLNKPKSCLNQTLNKPKSCINRSLNKPKSCLNRAVDKPKSCLNLTLNKPKSCLNRTLNKPKSYINQTLNKPKSYINRTLNK